MKILIIDNYDSFTYNLVHIVEAISETKVDVLRNDAFDISDLINYDKIILSPGPGIPDEAGLLKQVIMTYGASKHIFGVCLGQQAIGEVYGASLKNLKDVFHGKRTLMHKTEHPDSILEGVPNPFYAGRYHSWVIDKSSDLSSFFVTAIDDQSEIMAIKHKSHQIYGVQFHPESIMTDEGSLMVKNFLNLPL